MKASECELNICQEGFLLALRRTNNTGNVSYNPMTGDLIKG